MMRKLFPLLLALAGLVAGGGTGYVLRPAAGADADKAHPEMAGPDKAAAETAGHAAADQSAADHGADDGSASGHEAAPDDHADAPSDHDDGDHDDAGPDYVKLNNQFIVPVVKEGRVAAMVILSLSLEAKSGATETVFAHEPKLRDVFLQVLFDHANAGGFDGTFTDGTNLVFLRKALLEVAQRTMGDTISDVLIVDIARQDG
jgi:flagellar protein FliL